MEFFLRWSCLVCYLAMAFLTSDVASFETSLRHVRHPHEGHRAHHHGWTAISALQMKSRDRSQRARLSAREGLLEQEESPDQCRKHKYKWRLDINKRCIKSFGEHSIWDSSRGHGDYCRKGYKKCLTMYYVECCTRPEGPKELKDYCKIQESEGQPLDPACELEPAIQEIKDEVQVMVNSADELINPKPENVTLTTPTNASITTPNGTGLAPASAPAGAAPAGSVPARSAPATSVPGAPTEQSGAEAEKSETQPAEGGSATPQPEQTAVSTAGLEEQTSGTTFYPAPAPAVASPAAASPAAASPAAASPAAASSSPAAVPVEGSVETATTVRPPSSQHQEKVQDQQESLADQEKSSCERFVTSAQRVKLLLAELKKQKDRVLADENHDLDLNKQVITLLDVGAFVPEQQQLCQVKPSPEDDLDDDEDDSDSETGEDEEAGNHSDEMGKDDDDLEIEDSTRQEVVVVHTKVFVNLTVWVNQMSGAIKDVETKVHPNGRKWWRFRYEYTVIETIFLAISILIFLVLIYLLELLNRQSQRHVNLKLLEYMGTGLYRVNFRSFLLGSAAFNILFLVYWLLSYTYVFEWLAVAVKEKAQIRTPFFGVSYYLTLMDVNMHLFGGFVLYELFIMQVVREVRIELKSWRDLALTTTPEGKTAINVRALDKKDLNLMKSKMEAYRLEQRFFEKLENNPAYHEALEDVGLDNFAHLFVIDDEKRKTTFHVYLTIYMGECIQDLCSVSLPTWILMILTFVSASVFCWVSATGLSQFLIPLNLTFILILLLMYLVAKKIVREVLEQDLGRVPFRYRTATNLCQGIQFILFQISYGFTRIIMSHEFVTERFWTWVLVTTLFAVVYLLWTWIGAEIISLMLACLALPPHIPTARLADHIKELHDWLKEDRQDGGLLKTCSKRFGAAASI